MSVNSVNEIQFSLNPRDRVLHYGDRKLFLSRKETELLGLLVRHQGRYVDRTTLGKLLDQDGRLMSPENNVSSYICRIRSRMKQASLPKLIEHQWASGYKLTRSVEMEEDDGRKVLEPSAVRVLKRLIEKCDGTPQATLAHELREAVF